MEHGHAQRDPVGVPCRHPEAIRQPLLHCHSSEASKIIQLVGFKPQGSFVITVEARFAMPSSPKASDALLLRMLIQFSCVYHPYLILLYIRRVTTYKIVNTWLPAP